MSAQTPRDRGGGQHIRGSNSRLASERRERLSESPSRPRRHHFGDGGEATGGAGLRGGRSSGYRGRGRGGRGGGAESQPPRSPPREGRGRGGGGGAMSRDQMMRESSAVRSRTPADILPQQTSDAASSKFPPPEGGELVASKLTATTEEDILPIRWQAEDFPPLPGSQFLNEEVQQQIPLEQRSGGDSTSGIGLTLTVLRDGKVFVGLLKAFDQFGNLLLDRATQRITDPNDPRQYSEIYVGLLIVRGENVVLFGNIDAPETLEERVRRLASVPPIEEQPAALKDEEATGAPLQPIAPFAACEEVPLGAVLISQAKWAEQGRIAERRVVEYRRKLAEWKEEFRDDASLVDLETGELRSVEDAFVLSLLRRAGSPERGGATVQEVATAKLLFKRWIKATAEAIEELDQRGQDAIEHGSALDAW